MMDIAICLEVWLNKPPILENIILRKDICIRKESKDKLSLDHEETLEKNLEEEEDSMKDLLKWIKYQVLAINAKNIEMDVRI